MGLHWFVLTLAVIGAINWGLVGLFGFDLVAALFGHMSPMSRIVYTLVGVAGAILIATSSAYTARSGRVRTVTP